MGSGSYLPWGELSACIPFYIIKKNIGLLQTSDHINSLNQSTAEHKPLIKKNLILILTKFSKFFKIIITKLSNFLFLTEEYFYPSSLCVIHFYLLQPFR